MPANEPGAPSGSTLHRVAGSDSISSHPSVLRVRSVLSDLGVPGEIRILDASAHTAALAAEQLGVEVAAIANSLLFSVPDAQAPGTRRPVLVMTSGAHRVTTSLVADHLGAERLDRADADFVHSTTGFRIGGVAPVGHVQPLQTLIDVTLAGHSQLWAAAGHPRAVFATHYDELLRITGGAPVEVV